MEPGGLIPNSTGGGRGGYTFANNNLDPLTNAPESCSWAGDGRKEGGGLGGRPFPAAQSQLYFGGGGGAGHENNGRGGNGGRGGGLVFIIAGRVQITSSGSASIEANGEKGVDAAVPGANDGSGGKADMT